MPVNDRSITTVFTLVLIKKFSINFLLRKTYYIDIFRLWKCLYLSQKRLVLRCWSPCQVAMMSPLSMRAFSVGTDIRSRGSNAALNCHAHVRSPPCYSVFRNALFINRWRLWLHFLQHNSLEVFAAIFAFKWGAQGPSLTTCDFDMRKIVVPLWPLSSQCVWWGYADQSPWLGTSCILVHLYQE